MFWNPSLGKNPDQMMSGNLYDQLQSEPEPSNEKRCRWRDLNETLREDLIDRLVRKEPQLTATRVAQILGICHRNGINMVREKVRKRKSYKQEWKQEANLSVISGKQDPSLSFNASIITKNLSHKVRKPIAIQMSEALAPAPQATPLLFSDQSSINSQIHSIIMTLDADLKSRTFSLVASTPEPRPPSPPSKTLWLEGQQADRKIACQQSAILPVAPFIQQQISPIFQFPHHERSVITTALTQTQDHPSLKPELTYPESTVLTDPQPRSAELGTSLPEKQDYSSPELQVSHLEVTSGFQVPQPRSAEIAAALPEAQDYPTLEPQVPFPETPGFLDSQPRNVDINPTLSVIHDYSSPKLEVAYSDPANNFPASQPWRNNVIATALSQTQDYATSKLRLPYPEPTSYPASQLWGVPASIPQPQPMLYHQNIPYTNNLFQNANLTYPQYYPHIFTANNGYPTHGNQEQRSIGVIQGPHISNFDAASQNPVFESANSAAPTGQIFRLW